LIHVPIYRRPPMLLEFPVIPGVCADSNIPAPDRLRNIALPFRIRFSEYVLCAKGKAVSRQGRRCACATLDPASARAGGGAVRRLWAGVTIARGPTMSV